MGQRDAASPSAGISAVAARKAHTSIQEHLFRAKREGEVLEILIGKHHILSMVSANVAGRVSSRLEVLRALVCRVDYIYSISAV